MNLDSTIEKVKFPDKKKLEEFWKKRYNAHFHITYVPVDTS